MTDTTRVENVKQAVDKLHSVAWGAIEHIPDQDAKDDLWEAVRKVCNIQFDFWRLCAGKYEDMK